MEMHPQVHENVDDVDPDNLNEVPNGSVSGKIEAFNGLADGNYISRNLLSKNGQYGDLPSPKISEFMKLGSLETASTHSLFSAVTKMLDESIEKSNEDIPQRAASLLKLVVQELEQRVSNHGDYMKKQNNLYKSREDRYQSKIKALETLATGTIEENEIVVNQLQEVKLEKMRIEEKIKKLEEHDLVNLKIEKDKCESQILSLKEELSLAKKDYNDNYSQLEAKAGENQDKLQIKIMELESQVLSLKEEMTLAEKDYHENYSHLEAKAKENHDKLQINIMELESQVLSLKEELTLAKKDYNEKYSQFEAKAEEKQDKLQEKIMELESQILSLKEDMAVVTKSYKENYFQLETKAEEDLDQLQKKIMELESYLTDSSNKVQELEDLAESKCLQWKRKEKKYENFINSQFQALQELKYASESIKEEVLRTKNIYAEEFHNFGVNMKELADAAQNYHSVFEENRKLYNEVQDLKGNIRVYCRIKPQPGKTEKQTTTVQFIGEDGELVVTNPSKPGKDAQRLFKFDKVFGPVASQEDVFRDTQPLIRSVLDGYNVCIFAYGQTGSGKTYTMTGPNMTSVADWGVNYRALNDLFTISQNRQGLVAYEVGVQMVEIYNEQVRDLLRNSNFQKRLGIWSSTQPNGLAVPDASVHPVKSTDDVLQLMNIGLQNRAVGPTALNERSSRSHSIVSVHVHGTDLETNGILHGCLHLVDLAGSERVDRSEVTGDRLREAQHINKSLSALGDVIFALAQKSSHVPYRNSKLTQVLQSSLGGRAKTLMFVQLNPDVKSYSETISTLKFAERVSGVELGAARSNKKGRGVAELMEQVATLKDAVSQKDDELRRVRLLKTNGNNERHGMGSSRYGSASPTPRRNSVGKGQPSRGLSVRKSASEKAASDLDNKSEVSDKCSEAGSQQSADEFKHHRDFFRQSRLVAVGGADNFREENELKFDFADQSKDTNEDLELLGFGEDDSEERLSDISDSVLSMAETDCSINSIVEYTLFPETAKPSEEITEKPNVPANLPRVPTKQGQAGSSKISSSRSSSKIPSFKRPTTTGSSSAVIKPSKRWQ